MALSLLALSKGQTSGSKLASPFLRPELWLIAGWPFIKARLVAPSRLALLKGQTCGSKPTGTFKRLNF